MSNPADKFDAQTRAGTGSCGIPPIAGASGRAQGRSEYRSDEPRRILPQLPVESIWPRPKSEILNSITARRAKSSMECLTMC